MKDEIITIQDELRQRCFLNNEPHWYMGCVTSCQEHRVEMLAKQLGYEVCLPIQKVQHQWSDRMKWVDKIVLPGKVFFHCTNQQRIEALKALPTLTRFVMRHHFYTGELSTPLIIPDADMRLFQMMCAQSFNEVEFAQGKLAKGDWVRVIAGPLIGCEFELIDIKGEKCIAANLGDFGFAHMNISINDVERIEKNQP